MTAEKDPRIEAVAKLLFTGPLVQDDATRWDEAVSDENSIVGQCLMAAEDVLRGIDAAAEWEYGMSRSAEVEPKYDERHARSSVLAYAQSGMRAEVVRRRIGQWEQLP